MLTCVLNRVLIQLEDLKREHELAPGIKIEIAYGELEKRHKAGLTEGTVLSIGPTAYCDYKLANGLPYEPLKVGDKVLVAKYSPRSVVDPESPDKELALINDEDVLAIITKGESK